MLIYTTASCGKMASGYASRLSLALTKSHLYSETSSTVEAENLIPVVAIVTGQ